MSLLELCVKRAGGPARGARVAAFIVGWGRVRKELGRQPTAEEYADFWKVSNRTAYYEQAQFRAAFKPLRTPEPILDHMAAQGLGESVDPSALQPA
jgi:hypothetical protein